MPREAISEEDVPLVELRPRRERRVRDHSLWAHRQARRDLSILIVEVPLELTREIDDAQPTVVERRVEAVTLDPEVVRSGFRHFVARDLLRLLRVGEVDDVRVPTRARRRATGVEVHAV